MKTIYHSKKFRFIILILCLFFLCFTFFPICSYGATPKIVKIAEDAFEDIEKWLLTISTPAAAVAVVTGLFIQKFSFGDEERIRTGKKLVKSALFCYAFVLGTDLVLAAIKALVK